MSALTREAASAGQCLPCSILASRNSSYSALGRPVSGERRLGSGDINGEVSIVTVSPYRRAAASTV